MANQPSALQHRTPMHVIDALDAVLDASIERHYHEYSDETLIECRCCGEWEGHTSECPIPAIERFMNRPL